MFAGIPKAVLPNKITAGRERSIRRAQVVQRSQNLIPKKATKTKDYNKNQKSPSLEYFVLPLTKAKQQQQHIDTVNNSVLKVVVGKVDFCLRLHQEHPHIKALWKIYGKLRNILRSPDGYETTLLVQGVDGGPILQAICSDREVGVEDLAKGSYLRLKGHLVGVNRLLVTQVQRREYNVDHEEYFRRMEKCILDSLKDDSK